MKRTMQMDVYLCDNCQRNLIDDEGHIGYIDADIFEMVGNESKWIEHEGKHYCPNCYEIDDEDNVVIKEIEL